MADMASSPTTRFSPSRLYSPLMLLHPADAEIELLEKPTRTFVPGTRAIDLPSSVTSTETNSRPASPTGPSVARAVLVARGDALAREGLVPAVAGGVGDGGLLPEGSGVAEGRAPTIEQADRDSPRTATLRAMRLFTAVRREVPLFGSRHACGPAGRRDLSACLSRGRLCHPSRSRRRRSPVVPRSSRRRRCRRCR